MKAPCKPLLAFAAAAWCFASPVHAEVEPSVTNSAPSVYLTLAQAIDEALQANPGLRAAGYQANAAESEASAARRTRWGNSTGSPTLTSASARAAM